MKCVYPFIALYATKRILKDDPIVCDKKHLISSSKQDGTEYKTTKEEVLKQIHDEFFPRQI